MDTSEFVEYEVVNLETDRRHFTDSREEAMGYFERGWLVFENRTAMFRPSIFTSTKTIVTLLWNNNPEFQEDPHENDA